MKNTLTLINNPAKVKKNRVPVPPVAAEERIKYPYLGESEVQLANYIYDEEFIDFALEFFNEQNKKRGVEPRSGLVLVR